MNMLVDSHGREVSYMRLSVTDRCNLRCFYCRSDEEPTPFIPHQDILAYEEMAELVGMARSLNVSKVRITGGEPFARRDFPDFLALLQKQCPDTEVRITTNGTLLSGLVPDLKRLGVRRLNISLDSLDRETFQRITGHDLLPRVLETVEECLAHGIAIKINMVALKGVNDHELPDFLNLAKNNPLDVRFIEFMPMGNGTRWSREYLWPAGDILDKARELARLAPVIGGKRTRGPARMYAIAGGKGRMGLISPMSNHHCRACNRLRITSDGRLRTCLFSDKEYRLRPLLRSPRLGCDAVLKVLRLATDRKPLGQTLLQARKEDKPLCGKVMSSIGG